MTTSIHSLNLEGFSIELELSNETFKPTTITKMIARHVDIPKSGAVLDLGCGVGVLAIFAALRGAAKVVAVDIMEEATRLAQLNVLRNKVEETVTVLCGSLFDKVGDEQFDVIIDDVSAVADEVARMSSWYPPSIPTGGRDGADVIVPMLLQAPHHLKPGGVLYFPTGTISNVQRTLDAAKQAFGGKVELVDEMDVPFPEELSKNIDAMQRLKDEGIVDFVTKRSRYLWQLQLYKAWI
jgi:methylase of polypeptide subunit release factors